MSDVTCELCDQPKGSIAYSFAKPRGASFGLQTVKRQHLICLMCDRNGAHPYPGRDAR